MTRVLIIGSGGREAAIVTKLAEDATIERIFCSPGSEGIRAIDEQRIQLVPEHKFWDLAQLARRQEVSLTVVGPEQPLVEGIVGVFMGQGLRIVGPTAAAAQLEGSKAFCKQLLRDNGIPTAEFKVFDDPNAARAHIQGRNPPIVVKASGLAAGKGVIVAHSTEEACNAVHAIMERHDFGREAGRQVVVEEYLTGRECSVIALTDGEAVFPLLPARDYKPAYNDNQGPNTGGMGSYAPVKPFSLELGREIVDKILVPTVNAMRKAGAPYRGILYAGLMLTPEGPKVLEFNCRFGDPEVQALLPLLNVPLLELLQATVDGTVGRLAETPARKMWKMRQTVCVVLASRGYPGDYEKRLPIEGIEDAEAEGVTVLHAGTARSPDGSGWVTNGGRVLNLVATDSYRGVAAKRIYRAAQHITFGGQSPLFRTDIAAKNA